MKTQVHIDADLLAFKSFSSSRKRFVKVFDKLLVNLLVNTRHEQNLKATVPKETHSEYSFEDIQRPGSIEKCLHTIKK